MSKRRHGVFHDMSRAAILEEARHGPVITITLGEKAEEDGDYPSGDEFTTEKIPARVAYLRKK